MSLRRLVAETGIVLLFATQVVSADRVSFDFIPDALSAHDMSPDGRFIVGSTDFDGDGFADGTYLLDTSSNEMTTMPALGLLARAVSDDGTVILGDIPDPTGVGTTVAGRWTQATGWQSLGHLPNAGACPSRSNGFELSADGSVAVGLSWDGCNGRGFKWTQDGGMEELEPLANGRNRASVISADGSVIGGFAQGVGSRTPAIWDGATLNGELLDPPDGDAVGEVRGLRDDGSVLLGSWLEPGMGPIAVANKWTLGPTGYEREQIAGGSYLPGWQGKPVDIADNGTIIGYDSLLANNRAWIQPEGDGPIISLEDYVEDNGGTIPSGFIVEIPEAITTNGRFIVGHGSGTGAWRISILADCDFDGDGNCDIADVDALVSEVVAGTDDPDLDLTGDGLVTLDDITDPADGWLRLAGEENLGPGLSYLAADITLDGVVDGQDFIEWNANKFMTTGLWSQGDVNADGVTDGRDFIIWNGLKFTSSAGASVPEPGAFAMLVSCFVVCCRYTRHTCRRRS